MYSATYSPDDNKLRLYASSRLDPETYARAKALGFRWAPKQDLFVAPAWSPAREDFLVELAGEVGDEDTSLTERAEERAERFGDYQEKRTADAEAARKAVARIADNIPFGQPILVGHHSERHARKDAERIENGMRKAVKMWRTAQYWEDRARGALGHAKYKERPDVRARRIKKLESELRVMTKRAKTYADTAKLWQSLERPESITKQGVQVSHLERVTYVAGHITNTPAGTYTGLLDGTVSAEEATRRVLEMCEVNGASVARWVEHYENRLTYEWAMLAESGGTLADRTGPEKGGGCKCWAGPRGGWAYIQKVNKVSVTVLDNWGNGGANFTRTIPFDKLQGVMTAADVAAARAEDRLRDTEDGTGFYVLDRETPKAPAPVEDTVCPDGPTCPDPECTTERQAQGLPTFEALAATLRAGVQVVSAPQLFPTPNDVARRMVELADIQPGNRVLEPSAGTGSLLGAMGGRMFGHNPERGEVVAVELNASLAGRLRSEFPLTQVIAGDFLGCNGELGTFDRIVMNPPFERGADIRHILHARSHLAPGGRLVAICANGSRQLEALQPLADSWEELPEGTFAGTGVRTVLLTLTGE